jgi:hypothetical protein
MIRGQERIDCRFCGKEFRRSGIAPRKLDFCDECGKNLRKVSRGSLEAYLLLNIIKLIKDFTWRPDFGSRARKSGNKGVVLDPRPVEDPPLDCVVCNCGEVADYYRSRYEYEEFRGRLQIFRYDIYYCKNKHKSGMKTRIYR